VRDKGIFDTGLRRTFLNDRRKRPVKGDTAHLEQVGHILAVLALIDELPDVLDLLPGLLWLGPGLTRRTRTAFIPATFYVLPSKLIKYIIGLWTIVFSNMATSSSA
jgi:hypothetical protein